MRNLPTGRLPPAQHPDTAALILPAHVLFYAPYEFVDGPQSGAGYGEHVDLRTEIARQNADEAVADGFLPV